MKFPTLTPWVIIRWSLVMLAFAATVAVAVDQVAIRDRKVAELTTKIDEQQKSMDKKTSENKRLLGALKEHEDIKSDALNQLSHLKELFDELNKAHEQEISAYKAQESLSVLKAATVQTSRPPAMNPQAYLPQPVIPVIPEPQTPAWIPPPAWQTAKIIKGRALAKWKDDFNMVEHEISQQTKALNSLLQYNKYAANRPLLARAAIQWPDDYHMMEYEFDKQVEALKKLNKR